MAGGDFRESTFVVLFPGHLFGAAARSRAVSPQYDSAPATTIPEVAQVGSSFRTGNPAEGPTGPADAIGRPSKRSGWQSWDTGVRATVIGTVAGVLSLLVAVIAWRWPQSPPENSVAGPPSSVATTTNPAATTGPPATAAPAAVDFLDAVTVEAGGGNLVAVPRQVRGTPGFAGHVMAISCPSNQTGDQVHDVTFPIMGHYQQFDAEIHPYYPSGADPRSVTYVTAMIGIRQTDQTLRTTAAGAQKNATMATASSLTAAIDNAEKLTVRVECADPKGTIILTNARLTPAG
jgi:hypothetical protein